MMLYAVQFEYLTENAARQTHKSFTSTLTIGDAQAPLHLNEYRSNKLLKEKGEYFITPGIRWMSVNE